MNMNIHPHPEWRRLLESTEELAVPGRFFSFEELSELAGIDIRTSRGRSQLVKFRKHLLVERELWLENDLNKGYRIVEAKEHHRCAIGQLRRARRRIRMSAAIVSHTRLADLTDEQRKANADILVRLARIESSVRETQTEVRKLVVESEPKRLPSPLLDQIAGKSETKQ